MFTSAPPHPALPCPGASVLPTPKPRAGVNPVLGFVELENPSGTCHPLFLLSNLFWECVAALAERRGGLGTGDNRVKGEHHGWQLWSCMTDRSELGRARASSPEGGKSSPHPQCCSWASVPCRPARHRPYLVTPGPRGQVVRLGGEVMLRKGAGAQAGAAPGHCVYYPLGCPSSFSLTGPTCRQADRNSRTSPSCLSFKCGLCKDLAPGSHDPEHTQHQTARARQEQSPSGWGCGGGAWERQAASSVGQAASGPVRFREMLTET